MGDAGERIPVQPSISSREHEELLNIIDTIRSQGISRYIDIPQIVVCGDQSSGKSSTLEAICGLRFPTSDGLCTRFATEYILRRGGEESVNISIIPDTNPDTHADIERTDAELAALKAFKPSQSNLEEFTTISKEAADAMGIDKGGRTFSHDVLRIEICGPTQPHLTLVDLPGLFHAGIDFEGDKNVDAVNSLVTNYIKKSRSIILAVVSAKNDLNLQKVIKFIRDHDPTGKRTLGVITKPDTLPSDSPSEAQYLKVAQNLEVPYALGWHVVKNRSFEQRDCSTEERDRDEDRWLSKGVWNALSMKQKGIGALRFRLSKVLQNHILAELPNLLKDVEAGIEDCTKRLETLGSSRGSVEEQRRYLLRASDKFTRLMSAAIDGTYTSAFFGSSGSDEGFEKRLRARTNDVLDTFGQYMRLRGHAVELVDKVPKDYEPTIGAPLKVKKEEFYQSIQHRMKRNSGRELPGLFNPAIIGDLFYDQSAPWESILGDTRDILLEAAHAAVNHALGEAADENTIRAIQREIVNPNMEPIEHALTAKVEEVLKPHRRGHPQTLNHYFIENIQKRREDESRKEMSKRIYEFFGKHPRWESTDERRWEGNFDVKHLLDTLVKQTEVDMGRFAAIEAINAMLAYYKVSSSIVARLINCLTYLQVALKNIQDVFSQYAIEECLLNPLPGIFTPESVYSLDEKTITRIAGESEQSIAERESLTKKLAVLKDTQKILHRMDRHKPSGRSAMDLPFETHVDTNVISLISDSQAEQPAVEEKKFGDGDDASTDEDDDVPPPPTISNPFSEPEDLFNEIPPPKEAVPIKEDFSATPALDDFWGVRPKNKPFKAKNESKNAIFEFGAGPVPELAVGDPGDMWDPDSTADDYLGSLRPKKAKKNKINKARS